MTSATFEITRTATIQSDDVGHKVSIAQLDFKPDFEYISTPKLVSHAFLKVKAKNESAYALLAGDANVFLDNNFLTKVSWTPPWITEIFYMPKFSRNHPADIYLFSVNGGNTKTRCEICSTTKTPESRKICCLYC